MRNIREFKNWLSEPIDGRVLGLFRIIFGLFMAYEAWVYYRMHLIDQGLMAPKILFKFDGFNWLPLLPQPAMMAILALMGISALLVAAGIFFRWACWLFSLSLAFIFFQEKSYYNNHIYLFILLGVLLSSTHADRFFSLRNKTNPISAVPRWQQFILQAQFVIVYFYGGLTKLKPDWLLLRQPMTSMAHSFPADHWMAPFFKTEFSIYLLTYGGFLLDILAPLLLWYKPVRRWAMIPFAVFNMANSRIFDDIGIFPFVMLCALILFFEAQELPFLRKSGGQATSTAKQKQGAQTGKVQPTAKAGVHMPATPGWVRNLLIGYFAFQLLFPFRGFFLPNPMDWTSIARNFSWRMKVDNRNVEEFKFTVEGPGQVMNVEVGTFANEMQILNISSDAYSVVMFARMLKKEAEMKGLQNGVVKARIRVRYNGRPPQFFVNPEVDLASVDYSPFQKLDWVMPLQE